MGITELIAQGYCEDVEVNMWEARAGTMVGALSSHQPLPIRSCLCAGPWAEDFRCYVTFLLTNQRKCYYSYFASKETGSERWRTLSEIISPASVFSLETTSVFPNFGLYPLYNFFCISWPPILFFCLIFYLIYSVFTLMYLFFKPLVSQLYWDINSHTIQFTHTRYTIFYFL